MCALVAPIASAQTQSPRMVRAAPDLIVEGSLVSLPGQAIRIRLAAPEGVDQLASVWIPDLVPVSLVDVPAADQSQQPISQILGFAAQSSDQSAIAPGWLAPPTRWTVVEPEQFAADPSSDPITWMLFIRFPEQYDDASIRRSEDQRERAVSIRIGREVFPVRLPEAPTSLPTGRIPNPQADTQAWRALGDLLAREAQDPTRRWRVALLAERLTAQRLFGTDSLEEASPMDDAVLRGVARTFEDEWRSAISSIQTADADLAARLLARITAITGLPNGTLVPVWPTDGEAEASLLPKLLSRTLTQSERLDAVRAYLQNQTSVRALVVDDAGNSLRIENAPNSRNSGAPAATIATTVGASVLLTDIAAQSASFTLGPMGQFESELLRLEPSQSIVVTTEVSTGSPDPQRRPTSPRTAQSAEGTLVLRHERSQTPVDLRVRPLEVFSPGTALGPMLERHDLYTFNASGARLAPSEWQTAAFLYQDHSSGRWYIYLEARYPSGLSREELVNERIEVHLGPYRRSLSVLSVSPNDAESTITDDRWSALLVIPEPVITRAMRDGTLPIGFVRTDSRSTADDKPGMTAWPRPLLPGESEPGRFRVKLNPI